MNKYAQIKYRLTLIFAITACLPVFSQEQEQETKRSFEDRIKNLEAHENTLNLLYENKAQELKNDLTTEFNKVSEEQKKKFDDLSSKYNIIVWFGFPGTIIAYLALLLGIKAYTNKKINAKIAGIVEQKRTDIIELIKSHELDFRLRKNSKLLVLSCNSEQESTLKRVFTQLDFNMDNVKFRTVDEYKSYDGNDLIIINNQDGGFDKKILNEYLMNDTNQIFVALTNENLERHDNLNFSNSEFTLYARIMESLKYQELRSL